MLRRLLALVLCTALPLPALAQTHVIAELGTAPLIGQVASTQQLQNDVREQRAVFAEAGLGLGLTPAEFAQFQQRIQNRQLAYVTIPRHLDAMSWRSGGRIHVLHNVVIPARTRGWEVDVVEHGQILALFIPNKCGNLSLIRKPAPALAQAKTPPPQVAAAELTPAPSPTPAPTVAPAATPAPAAATPAPYQSVAATTGPTHHVRAWPLLLLIPIVAALASHGGGTSVPPVTSSPVIAAPPPPPGPVVCPSPTPH